MVRHVVLGIAILVPRHDQARRVIQVRMTNEWNNTGVLQWFPDVHFPLEALVQPALRVGGVGGLAIAKMNRSQDLDSHHLWVLVVASWCVFAFPDVAESPGSRRCGLGLPDLLREVVRVILVTRVPLGSRFGFG